MSRPTITRKTRRVQVEMPANTPGLDVVAPMNMRTPEADPGWGQLLRILNVASPIVAEQRSAADKAALEQGRADARFGKIDAERQSKEDKYAEGVTEYAYLKQYQEARVAVLERASTELDETATVEEKTTWVDAQMANELRGLEEDPEFRRIIAPRYGDFINTFAAQEITTQLEENKQQAVDGETAVIQEALGSETPFSYDESHARLSKVVGRTDATDTLVDIITQEAVTRGDETILDLVPSSIATEDGQLIDGPRKTPRHAAKLRLAAAQIEKVKREALTPEIQWQEAQARRIFEDRILNTLPVSLVELEPYVKRGIFTPEFANSLVNRAAAAMEETKKKDQDWNLKFSLFRQTGTGSWVDTMGLPDGPETMKQAQDLTDRSYRNDLTAIANAIMANGDTTLLRPPLSGPEIAQLEGVSDELFHQSRGYRLPYTPMKSYMAEITPAQPDGVLARLPMYQKAKANGVAAMYVSPETQALFEAAISAQRAGEGPEIVKETLRRVTDPAVKEYVAENREFLNKTVTSRSMDVANAFLNEKLKHFANLPFVQSKMRALGEVYLSRGLSPLRAAELARERFEDTHFAIELGKNTLAIPESAEYDSSAAAAAFEWMQGAAQVFAKAQQDPSPEEATIVVDFGVGGRGVEVFFQGSDGARLNAKPFTIPAMIQQFRKTKSAQDYKDAVERNRTKQELRRTGVDPTRVRTSFSEAKWPM